jgi:hypothetical protein
MGARRVATTLLTLVVALAGSAAGAEADTLVTQWGGPPGAGPGQFANPTDLAVGAGGQVYVADSDNYRVQRFTADGAFAGQWGTRGTAAGQFSTPSGVATDAAGNVYVADRGNQRVQKFSADGTFQRAWGWGVATGAQAFEICTASCLQGLAGTGPGELFLPQTLTVDAAGNVYVTEFANNRVQRFASDGTFSGVVWGSAGSAPGQFARPVGIAAGAAGVYVADRDNNRIQRFNSAGGPLGQWGTAGPGVGQFATLLDVAVGPDGTVYAGETGNRRVQKFSAAGQFQSALTAVTGLPGVIRPLSLTLGPANELYVLDGEVGFRILKVQQTVAPSGPPPPVLGKAVNVDVVKGRVLVAVRSRGAHAAQKGLEFVPLEEARQIPTGSYLDTRHGTVSLTSATGTGSKTQAGKFSAGLFQVLQSRKRRDKGLTQLKLKGGNFKRCRTRGKRASAAALSKKTIRRVRSNTKGRFRARAKHSEGTSRGTIWLTADRCDGTLTKVTRGKVAVRDFRRKKTIIVKAGKSYLAR